MPGPVYLTSCTSCGAYPAASFWVSEVPQPEPFHCPRCRPGLRDGAEQLTDEHPEIRFVDEWEGSRWCVLEIQGDGFFLARRIGFPDSPAVRRHVDEILPVFSYRKLEQARAAGR